MTSLRVFTAAAILASGVFSFCAPALAAGDTEDTPRCKRGEVDDRTKNACVQAQSGLVDESLVAVTAAEG